MKLTQLLLDELDSEVERSRRVLKEVPEGKYTGSPRKIDGVRLSRGHGGHDPDVGRHGDHGQLDIAPADGPKTKPARKETRDALVEALDKAAADARSALQKTTDDYLMTPWKLLARGQVVMETPRHVMIRDTINHWAHHRGQMTVYLRLMGAKVPAIYGPSADEKSFQ